MPAKNVVSCDLFIITYNNNNNNNNNNNFHQLLQTPSVLKQTLHHLPLEIILPEKCAFIIFSCTDRMEIISDCRYRVIESSSLVSVLFREVFSQPSAVAMDALLLKILEFQNTKA